MRLKNLLKRGEKLRLITENIFFQEIELEGNDYDVFKEILIQFGWANVETLSKVSGLSIEEAKETLEEFEAKNIVWWTKLNGEFWYRLKPMSKKEKKELDFKMKNGGN